MAYDDLKSLIDHLDQSTVSYVQYDEEELHIILSKEVPQFAGPAPAAVLPGQVNSSAATDVNLSADVPVGEIITDSGQQPGETVNSPMVGVAYLQPKPGADPYVKVGDRVQEGQVVLIIEAMKLMNEIQANKSGIVTEILVSNEEVVEFGQPLIRID